MTADYDTAIAAYFAESENAPQFPPSQNIQIKRQTELRYGENSHQKAKIYQDNFRKEGITHATKLQGKDLSYNNFNDSDTALSIVTEFSDPTAVIIKHVNPCGVASSSDILQSFEKAFNSITNVYSDNDRALFLIYSMTGFNNSNNMKKV